MKDWELVIGLEVHIQLATNSKIFSGAATAFGAEPNTQACAVDLGMPGVLPVLNKEAVRMAVQFGLAVDAEVNRKSVFARKNYFYPDLPKGYQISQFELPIVGRGHVDIVQKDGTIKRVGVTRAHLEEDAGKSLHEDFHGMSGIDLNRASTPLLEIVSEPDLRSAEEAVAYLKTIHGLVRYLEICDGNMAEGSMRCDANVSVRRRGEEKFGTRCEIKNVNSFRFVEKAINYEAERQIREILAGNSIRQETRLYDSTKNETRSMRSKEEANDYRYFPDPDLLPLVIDDEYIAGVKAGLPELPAAKRERFIGQYGLSNYDATVLTGSKELAAAYETLVGLVGKEPKICANWLSQELAGYLNKENLEITESKVSMEQLAALVGRILDGTISGRGGKEVLEALWAGEAEVDGIIEAKGLKQMSDTGALEAIIDQVLAGATAQVEQYRGGKTGLFGFFVGQVMKLSKGQANPGQVNDILKKKLEG
ncbi:MAG: Asp-tRNA(Asn)/Glu-tRNA(Gln) amidotransferase subunit GatB [Gammaproteobacteria bacterium]|nr:Asp-tRNA(Asn)/Glu-tRNA(Gln) amidotransferase subunit GatB [Gammaproteobacteria bacterium]